MIMKGETHMCTEQVTREMQKHHDDAKKCLMDIAAYETPQEAQERFSKTSLYGSTIVEIDSFTWVVWDHTFVFDEYLRGRTCFVKWKLTEQQQQTLKAQVDRLTSRSIIDQLKEMGFQI